MMVLIGKTSAAMSGRRSEGRSVAATIRAVFEMTWGASESCSIRWALAACASRMGRQGVKTSTAPNAMKRRRELKEQEKLRQSENAD